MCECSNCSNEPTAAAAPQETQHQPQKPEITFDDFAKLDLRVGRVVEVAAHPNADKLLVLKVDLGFETRTICAGIKAYYAPEALLGRNIIIVANLAPRKLRGVESRGMLLAASNDDHSQVVLLTTEKEDVAPGSACG
ncbi:MAG TPA: methionine--tRNA ligase subunit beta [Phycisphaerae bacterium]|nr:methionine--tRNA ligase subunit beta [Phycisphaerae bacterium]HPS53325.1 methionine--tRNA ligase subunit beta [Phycisphaerae bacterium]